jgi:hypothetical protein
LRTINLVGKPSIQVLDTQTILCYTRSVKSMKLVLFPSGELNV